ncbi:hypothetical protein APHAL10511_008135 [Amanita phalloides]|nr:hypothetical protein APHAL10511_008135 [Amanita phalloides]
MIHGGYLQRPPLVLRIRERGDQGQWVSNPVVEGRIDSVADAVEGWVDSVATDAMLAVEGWVDAMLEGWVDSVATDAMLAVEGWVDAMLEGWVDSVADVLWVVV